MLTGAVSIDNVLYTMWLTMYAYTAKQNSIIYLNTEKMYLELNAAANATTISLVLENILSVAMVDGIYLYWGTCKYFICTTEHTYQDHKPASKGLILGKLANIMSKSEGRRNADMSSKGT